MAQSHTSGVSGAVTMAQSHTSGESGAVTMAQSHTSGESGAVTMAQSHTSSVSGAVTMAQSHTSGESGAVTMAQSHTSGVSGAVTVTQSHTSGVSGAVTVAQSHTSGESGAVTPPMNTNLATSKVRVVSDAVLPARPEAPASSDCCGNGCSVCVFDIYEQELVLWRKECEQIRRGELADKANTECPTLCPEEYHTFKIVDITKETDTCFKYKFSQSSQHCLQYNPGQHLILRWRSVDKLLTRQYTVISEPTATGYFEVLIKLYPDGCMSQYIRTWRVGADVEWRGPFGHFMYTPNMQPWVVLLAAGTGLAPMIHVVRTVLDNDQDETRLRLIYASRTYGDILLKTQLDTWQDFWNFSVLYVLSQDQPESGAKKRSSDQVHHGRLDETLLTQELHQLNCEHVKVLICGTKSFNRDMADSVQRVGLTEKDYFVF